MPPPTGDSMVEQVSTRQKTLVDVGRQPGELICAKVSKPGSGPRGPETCVRALTDLRIGLIGRFARLLGGLSGTLRAARGDRPVATISGLRGVMARVDIGLRGGARRCRKVGRAGARSSSPSERPTTTKPRILVGSPSWPHTSAATPSLTTRTAACSSD